MVPVSAVFIVFLLFFSSQLVVRSENADGKMTESDVKLCYKGKGESGPPGRTGKPGGKGLKGDKGLRGIPGQNGEKGERGEPGFTGPPGKTGHPGEVGAQGLPGKLGLNAHKGETGPPGPPGVIGSKGAHGIIGFPGPKGKPGIDGRDGSTGPAGQPGITGMQGPIGPQGPRGQRGQKGQKGEKGFVGPPGAEGADGIPGPPGHQGFQGSKGNKGQSGLPGYKGEQGSRGPQGPEVSEENVRRYLLPLKGLQTKVKFIQDNVTESLSGKLHDLQLEMENITATVNHHHAVLINETSDRAVALLYSSYGYSWISSGQRVTQWSTGHTGYLLQGGMKYSNGYITVPVSGVYYIYFQLTPDPYSSSYIYYDATIRVDGTAVARGYHHFTTYNGNSERSQVLSVVQNLRKGAQLSVQMEQRNYYYFNYPNSFFGAFKLSPVV